MKKAVISLGGSLIIPDQVRSEFLKEFRQLIVSKLDEFQFVIFTGGGATARTYMEGAAAASQITDEQKDWLGIHSSRLNAQLIFQIFRDYSSHKIIIDPSEKQELIKPITIGAGWKPGWSTDYCATQAAITNGFDKVINLSNIEYVYDKDPREFDDAERIEDITWADFRKIVGDEWKPGLNAPFDPIASKLAQERDIDVVVADGKNIENTKAILEGKEFKGTLIHN